MVGAVKVVKPFGKIHVCFSAVEISVPSAVPRLVGLVLSRNEAPILTTNLFKIEEREQ